MSDPPSPGSTTPAAWSAPAAPPYAALNMNASRRSRRCLSPIAAAAMGSLRSTA